MAISSYPSGFRGGALLKEVPLFDTISGNVFWVDSATGGAGNPGTFNRPLSTLDAAIGKCTANKGDFIFIKPGHSETYTAASSLALDVAGVTIVGLGNGSSRPTFVMDNTAATIAVSAANVTLSNVIIKASVADLVTAIVLSSTSTDFHLHKVSFYDDAAADNWIDAITTSTTDNAHDGLRVTGCEVVSDDTGNDAFIVISGNVDRFVFEDNTVNMGVADNEQVIEIVTGKIITNCSIQRNTVYRANIASTAESGDIFIGNDGTTNTGIIAYNLIGHLDPLAESTINVTGCRMFNNYSTGAVDTSGYLLPAADS